MLATKDDIKAIKDELANNSDENKTLKSEIMCFKDQNDFFKKRLNELEMDQGGII